MKCFHFLQLSFMTTSCYVRCRIKSINDKILNQMTDVNCEPILILLPKLYSRRPFRWFVYKKKTKQALTIHWPDSIFGCNLGSQIITKKPNQFTIMSLDISLTLFMEDRTTQAFCCHLHVYFVYVWLHLNFICSDHQPPFCCDRHEI